MNPAIPKIAGGVVAAGAAVAIAVALLTGNATFRSIVVDAFNGSSQVTREAGDVIEPYTGLALVGGDDVQVGAAADLTLAVDSDKHLYADPGTHFWLEAEGSEGDTRTTINMDAGATEHWIENKLAEGESYQVSTPSATMSVRGTVFRVELYAGSDGNDYTLVEVFDGLVEVTLLGHDGQLNGLSALFAAGEAALVRANSELTEFVLTDEVDGAVWETAAQGPVKVTGGGTGAEQHPLPYRKVPAAAAAVLVSWGVLGAPLSVTGEQLSHYTGLAAHDFAEQVLTPATAQAEGEGMLVCTVCGEEGNHYVIPRLADADADEAPASTEGATASAPAAAAAPATSTQQAATPRTAVTTQASGGSGSSTRTGGSGSVGSGSSSGSNAIPAHVHTVVVDAAVAATCTQSGLTGGSHCSTCGEVLEAQQVVAALGHSWHGPAFTWADDGSSATAARTCGRDGSHTQRAEATVTSAVTAEATCEDAGTTTYTASATFDDQAFTDELALDDLPALGHDWGEASFIWDEAARTAVVTRTCTRDASHVDEVEATVEQVSDVAATCEEAGTGTWRAAATVDGQELTDELTAQTAEPLGHEWGEPVFSWASDGSSATAVRTCAHDESHVQEASAVVTSEVATAATHLTMGSTAYTAAVTFDGQTFTDHLTLVDIPTVAHRYASYGSYVAATCTTAGHTAGSWCPDCGTVFSTGSTIAALGHDWDVTFTWGNDADGSPTCTATRTCKNDASHTEAGNVEVTTNGDTAITSYTATATWSDGTTSTETKEDTGSGAGGDVPDPKPDPEPEP